ncbi:hypothetical protein ACLOJK_021788 [Asimina triloba]
MTLVAGSYEKYLWGFRIKGPDRSSNDGSHSLKPLFSFPSHLSPIKSLSISYPFAASGAAADDAVKIYDISSLSVIGSLTDHDGAVTSISFFTPPSLSFPRNLFTASDDGTVCIYDVDPFVCLKTVLAHKKGINDLAVHPSGKVGLTVGRDACLGMLNLVRGKRSFCCRLVKEASIVRYDCGGGKFFMGTEEKASVHDSEDARMLFELENRKRVLCLVPGERVEAFLIGVIAFVWTSQKIAMVSLIESYWQSTSETTCDGKDGLLLTGGEDRSITAWDTRTGKVAYCIEGAHASRVKGLVVLGSRSSVNDDAELPHLIASASSDGFIRVWDDRMAQKGKPKPFAESTFKKPVEGVKELAGVMQED